MATRPPVLNVTCAECGRPFNVRARPGDSFDCPHCGTDLRLRGDNDDAIKNAGGVVGGAILGASVGGPVGAIIGGLLGLGLVQATKK